MFQEIMRHTLVKGTRNFDYREFLNFHWNRTAHGPVVFCLHRNATTTVQIEHVSFGSVLKHHNYCTKVAASREIWLEHNWIWTVHNRFATHFYCGSQIFIQVSGTRLFITIRNWCIAQHRATGIDGRQRNRCAGNVFVYVYTTSSLSNFTYRGASMCTSQLLEGGHNAHQPAHTKKLENNG